MQSETAQRASHRYRNGPTSWSTLDRELQALTATPTLAHAWADSDPWVIVGAGPSSQALLAQLALLAPQRKLIVINGEAFVPYNRAQISSAVAERRPLHTLAARLGERDNVSLTILHGVCATAIDREQRWLHLDNGMALSYDKLILATGSRPMRLPLLQQAHPRVRDFRGLHDLRSMAALRPRHVLVVGGGLLGVEAARASLSFCERVTLIERFAHLLPRQLDAACANCLAEQLTAMGVTILTGRQLASMHCREYEVELELDDHATLTADLVISATGVVAEVELARSAALTIDRGIVVGGNFQTCDEHIPTALRFSGLRAKDLKRFSEQGFQLLLVPPQIGKERRADLLEVRKACVMLIV